MFILWYGISFLFIMIIRFDRTRDTIFHDMANMRNSKHKIINVSRKYCMTNLVRIISISII